jgi:hypothetical protein
MIIELQYGTLFSVESLLQSQSQFRYASSQLPSLSGPLPYLDDSILFTINYVLIKF